MSRAGRRLLLALCLLAPWSAGAQPPGAVPRIGLLESGERRRLAELALKYRLPTVHGQREYVDAGGLIAYGADLAELFRRAAVYVDKILKGARPGDLPIEQPTKFELVMNLKTAKALGFTIPQSVLLRADQVIE